MENVTLKLFSINKYYTLGFKSIFNEVVVHEEGFYDSPKLKYEEKWMRHIIVLSGLPPDTVYKTFLYLHSVSVWIDHPILIVIDNLTPMLAKLASGTNIFVTYGKTNTIILREKIQSWINYFPSETHSISVNKYKLTYSEWSTLLHYMRFINMKVVADNLGVSLKTAYAHRCSALNKLGVRNMQDFIIQGGAILCENKSLNTGLNLF